MGKFCTVLLCFQMSLYGILPVISLSDPVLVRINANGTFYPEINPDEEIQFQLSGISKNTSFVLFQVHSYDERLSLSLDKSFTHDSSVNGRDVGVLSEKDPSQNEISWYLRRNASKSAVSLKILAVALVYGEKAPIPGGCNMESNLKINPNVNVEYSHYSNLVSFQFGRQGTPPNMECNVTALKRMEYTMYQYYSGDGKEAYFNALEDMLLSEGMVTNGIKARNKFEFGKKTQQRFAAFGGKAVVYNVIVSDLTLGSSAAYVPVVTHGCETDKVNCSFLKSDHAFDMLLLVALGIIGLFICFVGHRFFQTGVFVFGFLGFCIICFILMLRFSTYSEPVCLVVAAVCGLVGGAICHLFCYFKGMPIITVLFAGLVSGYLVSSIVFNFTPIKNILWWQEPLNYGLSFTCGVLVIPVLLLAFTRTLNLLSCSFIGGYLAVLVIDIFVKGNLIHIFLLSVHKATWDNFLKAEVDIPYQWTDLLLVIIWGLLMVGGATFQYFRERHRAPFPPCPWQVRLMRRHQSEWEEEATPQMPNSNIRESTNRTPQEIESNDENTPLLQGRRG